MSLTMDLPSQRSYLLLNIDEKLRYAGIVKDNWKLLVGEYPQTPALHIPTRLVSATSPVPFPFSSSAPLITGTHFFFDNHSTILTRAVDRITISRRAKTVYIPSAVLNYPLSNILSRLILRCSQVRRPTGRWTDSSGGPSPGCRTTLRPWCTVTRDGRWPGSGTRCRSWPAAAAWGTCWPCGTIRRSGATPRRPGRGHLPPARPARYACSTCT